MASSFNTTHSTAVSRSRQWATGARGFATSKATPFFSGLNASHLSRSRASFTRKAVESVKSSKRGPVSWVKSALGFGPEVSLDSPPVAPKGNPPQQLRIHGRIIQDEYGYLADGSLSRATKRYYNDEAHYVRLLGGQLKPMANVFYKEMKKRLTVDAASMPEFIEGFYYYVRKDKDDYFDIYCRKRGSADAPEEVVLDGNEFAKSFNYLHITTIKMSLDHSRMAWLADTKGEEEFSLYVKNLATGQVFTDEVIPKVGNMEWLADGSAFYYTSRDEKFRGARVYRHQLGTPISEDSLVFEEKDDRFFVDLVKTKDWQCLFIAINSKTTSEYYSIDMKNPKAAPQLIMPRKEGVEVFIDHAHGDYFIITNDVANHYRIVRVPTGQIQDKSAWKVFVEATDDVHIEDAELLENYLVLYENHIKLGGVTKIRLLDLAPPHNSHYVELPPLSHVSPGANTDFRSKNLRLHFSSPILPESTFDYNLETKKLNKLHEEVLLDYDPNEFQCSRVRVPNGEVEVPLTLIHSKSLNMTSGRNPTLVLGYGAYGNSMETRFRPEFVPLLQRGWVLALAHCRGGSELGRKWYDGGKKVNKRNTFSDFVACANHLVASKVTSSQLLCAKAASAGGLILGVVANENPGLFKAMIAKVPFVDVISSMMDEKLPLTTHEFDEWGNILEEPITFSYVFGYDPYRNVRRQEYPHLLVSGSTMDIRVPFWQPLKWVAKLRANKTDKNMLALLVDETTGHFGDGGPEGRSTEAAYDFAFLYKAIGKSTVEELPTSTTPSEQK